MIGLRVDGSLEESRTAALVASGRLFGRELTAALFGYEWTALLERVNSGSEAVGSLVERRDRDRLFGREA